MLQLAFAFGAAMPLPFAHRVRTVGSWARIMFHLALAFTIAVCVYGLIMLAIVVLYPANQPFATWLYTAGLAIASPLGIAAGTMLAPTRFARFTLLATAALAALLPALVSAHGMAVGHWSAAYLLYLSGSIAACALAVRAAPGALLAA